MRVSFINNCIRRFLSAELLSFNNLNNSQNGHSGQNHEQSYSLTATVCGSQSDYRSHRVHRSRVSEALECRGSSDTPDGPPPGFYSVQTHSSTESAAVPTTTTGCQRMWPRTRSGGPWPRRRHRRGARSACRRQDAPPHHEELGTKGAGKKQRQRDEVAGERERYEADQQKVGRKIADTESQQTDEGG